MMDPNPRIVALGGGHGLYATLSAARRLTAYVTAVVTVADDGGSSGRLRGELDIVPPGDLRMALAALASDSPQGRLWATIIQHRFGGSGALAGHPIGNLLLAGLDEVLADPVAALDELGRILGVRGRVLPMCPIGLQIEADVTGLESDPRMSRVIRGQVAVATTPGQVRRVRLLPGRPPATPQAVDAIAAADLVVLGPGSWFSSVIPHVLVPGLLAALQSTSARRALVLNLADEAGRPPVSAPNGICTCWRSTRRTSPSTTSSWTRPGCPANGSATSCGGRPRGCRPMWCSPTFPGLVHHYMTRRSLRRRCRGFCCGGRRMPIPAHRPPRDGEEVTVCGDDRRGQG